MTLSRSHLKGHEGEWAVRPGTLGRVDRNSSCLFGKQAWLEWMDVLGNLYQKRVDIDIIWSNDVYCQQTLPYFLHSNSAIIVSCIYILSCIYIQMEGNTMDEQLQTRVSSFPKDWILGRLGGVSSTADDKSNGNLFVPGSLEVWEEWWLNNKEAKMVKGDFWLSLCVYRVDLGDSDKDIIRSMKSMSLNWNDLNVFFHPFSDETLSIKSMLPKENFTQSQKMLAYPPPSILLKQNSRFLDTSNTLPLSLFPQVSHAFLLRQCHPHVQVGSRSCAACHRSFCRSFGKEA